jgi:TetR/AcrR family transcriptional repressor of mexJK operon
MEMRNLSSTACSPFPKPHMPLDEPENPDQCPSPPRTAGRPRSTDADSRTQHLMATAAGLFLERGYQQVSLEQIARTAHVAVRTIYVKFGGKAGLFRAIVRSARHGFFTSMEDLQATARPLREVLVDFAARMHGLMSSPAMVNLHRLVIAEADADPALGAAFFEAGPRQTREMLWAYFARAEVRAQLRDLPAVQLTDYLLDCVMGDPLRTYLFGLPDGEDGDDLALAGARVDLFLGGCAGRNPPPTSSSDPV